MDAATFARCGERELAHYRKIMPDLPARIQLRDDIPGVMVSRGQFLIGRRVHIPVARMEATLQHEIGTHVVTYCNGSRQPFAQLREGMCGYEELQEAIAVLAEYLVGGLSRPRMRVLAGRVVAVACLTRGADFMETFGELTLNCHFSRKEAFMIAMRVHRGGGLTKDMVYLRGLAGLLRYLGKGEPLEDLLIGKIALHHMVFVNDLKWRNILEPVLLRPRFLDDPAARRRLDHLKKGVQVSELMGQEGA